MAINRYTRNTPYQAGLNNFRLNYEQLADPIINATEEYNRTQAAQDAMLDSFRKTQVSEKDSGLLDQKIGDLINEEAMLRQSAGGDLTDPLYQDSMRQRFRQEAVDPFYRDAVFMKGQFDAWSVAHQQHRQEYGRDPSDWQDPFGVFAQNFANSEQSGTMRFTGIEKRDPFYPKAMTFLSPKLKAKMETGELKFDTDRTSGKRYIVDRNGARVTSKVLREILELNSELMNGRSMDQMRLDYEEKVRKGTIDTNRYPSFDDYLDEELESIANALSYEWNDEKFVGFVPEEETETSKAKSRGSIRKQQSEYRRKVQEGAYKDYDGASSPIHAPDYSTSQRIRNSYRVQENELMTKGVRRIENMLGINGENRHPDRKLNATTEVYTVGKGKDAREVRDTQLQFSYITQKGIKRNIDLTGPEILLYRQELADLGLNVTDLYLEAQSWDNGMNEAINNGKRIDDFDMRAGSKAFDSPTTSYGRRGKNPGIKEQGFFEGYLDDKQRAEVLQSRSYMLMSKLLNDGSLDNMKMTSEGGMIPGSRMTGGSGSTGSQRTDLLAGRKDAYRAVAEILGIDLPDNAIGGDLDSALRFEVEQRLKNLTPEEKERILFDAREVSTRDMLEKSGDPGMRDFLGYYSKNWTDQVVLGLDYDAEGNQFINPEKDLKDRHPDILGREDGIRQREQRVYHLNVLNSTGSESGENYLEQTRTLVGGLLGSMLPGTKTTKGQGSGAMLYQFGNDVAVDENVLSNIGQDWQLIGFTFDDQGTSLVIQSDLDPDTPEGGVLYEIRNSKEVFDFLHRAGFQHKNVLHTVENILTGLNDDSGEFTKGYQHQGQTRSKLSTTVDVGGYSAPVYRAHTEMLFEGMHVQEGEFMFFSQTDQRWLKSSDPIDITLELFKDKVTQHDAPGESVVYDNAFNDRVKINPKLTEEGRAIMSKSLFEYMTKVSEAADPPSNIQINSTLRDHHHDLAQQNPKSMHLYGDAVDVQITNSSGKVIEEDLQKYIDLAKDNPGIEFLLEFPSVDHPDYKYYKEMYPDITAPNSGATGIHLHIEYNRDLLNF